MTSITERGVARGVVMRGAFLDNNAYLVWVHIQGLLAREDVRQDPPDRIDLVPDATVLEAIE
ncbi:MAG: hypothetical protein ABI053_06320 [Lacisediminihabitans sp.]